MIRLMTKRRSCLWARGQHEETPSVAWHKTACCFPKPVSRDPSSEYVNLPLNMVTQLCEAVDGPNIQMINTEKVEVWGTWSCQKVRWKVVLRRGICVAQDIHVVFFQSEVIQKPPTTSDNLFLRKWTEALWLWRKLIDFWFDMVRWCWISLCLPTSGGRGMGRMGRRLPSR